MGIARNDNDYSEVAATCDYCYELECKPFPFYDERTQFACCEKCVKTIGFEELQAWCDKHERNK
jgi:hypothetical protein